MKKIFLVFLLLLTGCSEPEVINQETEVAVLPDLTDLCYETPLESVSVTWCALEESVEQNSLLEVEFNIINTTSEEVYLVIQKGPNGLGKVVVRDSEGSIVTERETVATEVAGAQVKVYSLEVGASLIVKDVISLDSSRDNVNEAGTGLYYYVTDLELVMVDEEVIKEEYSDFSEYTAQRTEVTIPFIIE